MTDDSAATVPLAAVGFLGWIFIKSLSNAPWTQRCSLIGIVAAGVILMFSAPHPTLNVLPDRAGKRGVKRTGGPGGAERRADALPAA